MLVSQVVNGLLLGSLYALITLSYALVLGVLRIFNLAQAEVFAVGGVLGWVSITMLELPPVFALPVVMAGGAFLGLVTELFCVRRSLAGGSFFVPIALTIALAAILLNLMEELVGTNPLPISIPVLYTQVDLYLAEVPLINLVVFGSAICVLALLALYFRKHPLGLATRAVGENIEVSELLGINSRRVIQITFAISGGISALCGLLFGLMTSAAHPYMGEIAGLKGICLVIIGGMGSISGAVIAAFIGGVAEVLTAVYLSAKYVDGVLWMVLFMILVFRPTGLLGQPKDLERIQ